MTKKPTNEIPSLSEDFLKWFNQTKFMVAVFSEGTIFFLPHSFCKLITTPPKAMEYVKTRDYDCCQLFWQVGSDIQDILVIAAYNKNKSSEWFFADKAESYMLRIEDWRKDNKKQQEQPNAS